MNLEDIHNLSLNQDFEMNVLKTIWAIDNVYSLELEKEKYCFLNRPFHESIIFVDYLYSKIVNKV